MATGLVACGHIPGYYPEGETTPEATRARPTSPPAPAPSPAARRGADEEGPEEADASYTDEGDGDAGEAAPSDDAPPYEPPAKRPPRYSPPPAWDPPEAPAQPAPAEPVRQVPIAPPPAAPAERANRTEPAGDEGLKTIRLDADTYYLVDLKRNLCFLRHKESMTAIDCARVAEPSPAPAPAREVREPAAPARQPRPEESRPPVREAVPAPEPTAPTPAPSPASPSPDEITRFEAAFSDIFCDRKRGDDTTPEDRIAARGLSVQRYEAIEGWWAGDEKAWFALTTKAAGRCKR